MRSFSRKDIKNDIEILFSISHDTTGLRLFASLPPHIPIERPVLDSLSDMPDSDALLVFQVGDGARHLEDAVVDPRRQPEPIDGRAQQVLVLTVDLAKPPDVARLQVGVVEHD
jgi:hypothetical protein